MCATCGSPGVGALQQQLPCALKILHGGDSFFFFGGETAESGNCTEKSHCHVLTEPITLSPQPKRWSPTTSCTLGTWPSAPGEARKSSRDSAYARAAAQLSIEAHLRRQAARALSCISAGTSLNLACASEDKNDAVSLDHRPPVSPASTTRRALPPWPEGQWPGVKPHLFKPTSTANWTPPKRGRPSTKTSRVEHVGRSQIQTTKHDIGGDPASLAVDPCCDILQIKPPPPQDPSPCTSCAVVATGIEWKATPATAPGKGEGKTKTTEEDSE